MADNWNIDIAAELEEYLEDLESVVISFDGGKSNLNFAEAALMIQVGITLKTLNIRDLQWYTAKKLNFSTTLYLKH